MNRSCRLYTVRFENKSLLNQKLLLLYYLIYLFKWLHPWPGATAGTPIYDYVKAEVDKLWPATRFWVAHVQRQTFIF